MSAACVCAYVWGPARIGCHLVHEEVARELDGCGARESLEEVVERDVSGVGEMEQFAVPHKTIRGVDRCKLEGHGARSVVRVLGM
eukprot:CAMPEP_0183346518 /NCGR_PEP_ID=MMETSP0164_2-20130417/11617_1 /TAXON_ID=221442 /ORGANISM="Coccolithus pelagicus ssp braarudi, Strain PLY182g" /LENGTH=84 /DNA_ID=CAMNT_0025517807 /DNA_START=101 /DNA_END=352 /DNA_ORIENTATION=-